MMFKYIFWCQYVLIQHYILGYMFIMLSLQTRIYIFILLWIVFNICFGHFVNLKTHNFHTGAFKNTIYWLGYYHDCYAFKELLYYRLVMERYIFVFYMLLSYHYYSQYNENNDNLCFGCMQQILYCHFCTQNSIFRIGWIMS